MVGLQVCAGSLDLVIDLVSAQSSSPSQAKAVTFVIMDERPRLAEAFRKLREGEGPLWVTWKGRRLLIGSADEQWLERGVGPALIATRRGYKKVVLIGRVGDDGGTGPPRLRTDEDYFNPITDMRVRAVILEEHDR